MGSGIAVSSYSIKDKSNYTRMKKTEGYWDSTPKIKDISFPVRGKMQVNLTDGRVIIVPLSAFPSIQKLTTGDRESYFLLVAGYRLIKAMK